jgi:hypothetical protein
LSSLRCFFLAIRLRRFLMTEPTAPPSALTRQNGKRARPPARRRQGQGTRPVKTTAAPSRAVPPAHAEGTAPRRYCCPRVPSDQVS